MIFLGPCEIVDIFWGHHNTGLLFLVNPIHSRACPKGQVQNWNTFGVAKFLSLVYA